MTTVEVRPPVPARLASRPLTGGLVVPWVNVRLADGGTDFRSTHRTKWQSAWVDGVCQTCGDPLDERPVVLLGGPRQLETYFTEPPLHPECAAYAAKACPMVAGRMPVYPDRPHVAYSTRGTTCPEPGCGCGGWIPSPDGEDHGGEPAHAWWAVWCDDWGLAVTPEGRLLGGMPVGERRRRLVSTPDGDR